MYNIKPRIKFYMLRSFSPCYSGGDFSLTLSIHRHEALLFLKSMRKKEDDGEINKEMTIMD